MWVLGMYETHDGTPLQATPLHLILLIFWLDMFKTRGGRRVLKGFWSFPSIILYVIDTLDTS